jgi:hypothetical protein
MSAPSIIYKKFHKYKPTQDFKGHQWFALTNSYGTEYGNITRGYNFKKPPKLLDIGDADVRIMIEDEVKKKDPKLVRDCHPDEQYSGTTANKKYHNLVKDIFGQEYDGTIIDGANLKSNSKYSIDDLEGPSEIVIWKDYNDLLEEIPEEDVSQEDVSQEDVSQEDVSQEDVSQEDVSNENMGKGINKSKKGNKRTRTNKKRRTRKNRRSRTRKNKR